MANGVRGEPRARGLIRLIGALRWSLAGLRECYRGEEAFRLELAAFVVLAPLALWLGHDGVSRALLLGSLVLVLVVELLNTAVEATVDRVSDARHPLSKLAKDLASAAVFVSLLGTAAVWALVIWG